jgi:hypothetical protein
MEISIDRHILYLIGDLLAGLLVGLDILIRPNWSHWSNEGFRKICGRLRNNLADAFPNFVLAYLPDAPGLIKGLVTLALVPLIFGSVSALLMFLLDTGSWPAMLAIGFCGAMTSIYLTVFFGAMDAPFFARKSPYIFPAILVALGLTLGTTSIALAIMGANQLDFVVPFLWGFGGTTLMFFANAILFFFFSYLSSEDNGIAKFGIFVFIINKGVELAFRL